MTQYVVKVQLETGPSLFGPFPNHEAAHRWASGAMMSYNWSIHPLNQVT